MRKLLVIAILSVSLQFVNAQQNKSQDVVAIKSARAASNKAIAAHDVNGIGEYLLDDFTQVRGNATHLTGKDTILKTWKQLFLSNPKVSYEREPSEITISDNDTLAWETGKWKAVNSYSKGGNYSAMWRRVGGKWKIQAELFVSLKD